MILPTRSISYLGTMVLLGVLSGHSALAEEQNVCACVLAQNDRQSAVATIEDMTGTVMVAQSAGFTEAENGFELGAGSRVIVGAKSTAVISAGATCTFGVPENTDVSFVAQEDNICVKLDKPLEMRAANASGSGVTYADRTLGSEQNVFSQATGTAAGVTTGLSSTAVTGIGVLGVTLLPVGIGEATGDPVSE